MSCRDPLACHGGARRQALLDAANQPGARWNGLDYLDLSDDQRTLCVHFFGPVPEGLTPANICIAGGRRIRGIEAIAVEIHRSGDPELDDCLRITLDRPGDFSTYRICLVEADEGEGDADPCEDPHAEQGGGYGPAAGGGGKAGAGAGAAYGEAAAYSASAAYGANAGAVSSHAGHAKRKRAAGEDCCIPPQAPLKGIDPRFACLDFSFKVGCPSDLDCQPVDTCAPDLAPPPEISYLAKDYGTFRQLILDRLALIMPEWRERHVPDLNITLVELLAYVGDYLSYYQDAVATEAYLDTARQRISVRRHTRLVDYRLHEGVNARAWVTVETAADLEPLPANSLYFITGFPDIPAASGRIVRHEDLQYVARTDYEVFEPLVQPPDRPLQFYQAHSRIRFYTWGELECCLAKGATRATLWDEPPTTGEPPPPPPSPEGEPAPYGYASTPEKSAKPGKPSKSEQQDHAARPAYSPKSGYPSKKGKGYDQEPEPPPPPPRLLHLEPGDVLIFEEVIGPVTGNPADADPTRRHAVRLTSVTPAVDGLLGNRQVLEITWAPEDALPFTLCLSSRLPAPDCRRMDDVSIARGNVVLVDHGRTEREDLGPVESTDTFGPCGCDGSLAEWTSTPAPFRPELQYAPLTFAEPTPSASVPASRAVMQDERRALPAVWLTAYRPQDTTTATGLRWHSREDLLASSPDDRHFVAEMDDAGRAHLRFGDGDLGRLPPGGARFQSVSRTGNGPAGNVGRETISYLVIREGSLSADEVLPTNPLPARGGLEPEPIAEAKLLAPHAFRERLERAITGEDYGTLAGRTARVQRAVGELRWTGSWYEARVAVDPAETSDRDRVTLRAVAGALHRYRRMGHDLAVVQARYAPLDVALEICVCPRADRGHVKAALLDIFSNRRLRDGQRGLFHPDTLTFGDGVRLSTLVAAAKGVAGVDAVRVARCHRLDEPAGDELDTGVLSLGAMEIARLDNDPNFPEHGTLELMLRGGR